MRSDDLKTKRADNFLDNLSTDQYQNITAEFRVKGDLHNITSNANIIGRGNNLNKVKETCRKVKQEVLQCIINNNNDQNGNDESLAALMSMFDFVNK